MAPNQKTVQDFNLVVIMLVIPNQNHYLGVSILSETGNRIVAGDDIPWGESVDLISRTNLNNLIATQDLKYSFLQGPRNAY